MKNFWRRMAAREGFTLVELVVVIAILAILAAVAYPAYTGYIAKAREASAVEQLGAIHTAAQGAAATTGAKVEKISISATDGTVNFNNITVEYDKKPADADTTFALLLTGSTTTTSWSINLGDGTYATGAHWTSSDGWQPGPSTT